MTQTILDTSSLIALALAQRDSDIRAGDSHSFWCAHGGIDAAIEALVLHDDLVFDGPSIRRNLDALPELGALTSHGELLWESDTTLESRIYSSILRTYVPQIAKTDQSLVDLFRMHMEDWMAAEVGVKGCFPSVHWGTILRQLNGEASALASSLQERFGVNTPMSGAACALLLRTLYYDRLQQFASAHLILHPLKGAFLGGIKEEDDPKALPPDGGWKSSTILSIFDEKVRRAFYERKKHWLGRVDLQFEVPILTNFVLGRCKTWRDLTAVVGDVRNSSKARGFREGMRYLTNAVTKRQNKEVDEILSRLSAAATEWSTDLRPKSLTRKVRVTLPIINVGSELDVPDIKLGKNAGDHLLVFVSSLLLES